MTVLVNLGSASTDGTLVTTGNSGGTGSNAFNTVNDDTMTSVTWEADAAWPGASLGIVFHANMLAGQAAYAAWSTSLVGGGGTASQLNAGASLYVSALPGMMNPASVALIRALLSGNQRWRVGLRGDGKLVVNGNADTNFGASSLTIATGTQYYIEVGATGASSGATAELRIYNSSGTLLETMGPYTSRNTGGPVNEIRFGIGASVSLAGSISVNMSYFKASDSGWMGPPVVAVPSVAAGPLSGAVTDTTATVAYRLADSAGLNSRLVVSTTSNLTTSPIYSSSSAPDADGVIKRSVSGLSANTTYYYGVEVNGNLLSDGRGQLKTFPTAGSQANHCVAFGSCHITNQDTNTWDLVRTYSGPQGSPLMLLHLGDMGYPDWTTAVGGGVVRAHYEQQIALPKMNAMLDMIPIAYTPNNHDLAGGLCDKNSASVPSVAAGFRQFIAHYSLPHSGNIGFYQSFVIGRVQYILLDMRSLRDPAANTDNSSKSMLGSEQLTWLTARLQDPSPVKVICSDIWRAEGFSSGRWGAYTYEFGVVNNLIDTYCPGRVIIASGDRHALAADNGTAANTRGVANVVGGVFNQGSEESHESWSDGYFYSYQVTPVEENIDSAGFLNVVDSGSSIAITYKGVTSEGTERISYTKTFNLSVSKGNNLRYNTFAKMTDTNDLRYNTFAKMSDAVDLRYNAYSKITDATDLRYNAFAKMSDASDLRWNTPAVTSDAMALRYDAYAKVSDAIDLRWDTTIGASSSSIIRYDSRATSLSSSALRWNTPSVIVDSVALRYDAYASMLDAIDLRYQSYAKADVSNSIAWNSYAGVLDSVDVRWTAYASASASNSVRYNVAALIQAAAQVVYDLYAPVSAECVIRYEIEGFGVVSKTVAIRYETRAKTSAFDSIVWNAYAKASDSSEIRYHSYAKVSDASQLSWHSYVGVADSNLIRWNVFDLAESSVQVLWDLEGRVHSGVDLRWLVEGEEVEVLVVNLDDGPIIVNVVNNGPVTAAMPSTRAV